MKKELSPAAFKFAGKNIVITGSGTGIGQAIAKKFAEEGANIIIMGRRKAPLDYTLSIIRSIIKQKGTSGSVRAFSGVDVSDEQGIHKMFENIEKEFGTVDILVNNAGVSGPVKTFTNANFDEFCDCVSIHLTGTFWTTIQALRVLQHGSKVITISTFFTEENRFEQRPYRFRAPYTSAQGAKNRLSEALAWELAEKGIQSVITNPGPVHSDRIYKTVYPKAAAEFLRIGGYDILTSIEIEKATLELLAVLGEDQRVIEDKITNVALELTKARGSRPGEGDQNLHKVISGLLSKIQEIAEKVQNNTRAMIVDSEFLTQEEVAEMILNISNDKISKLINGRIIPNDRVFYPVKPSVGTLVEPISETDVKHKVVILTLFSDKNVERLREIIIRLNNSKPDKIIILTNKESSITELRDFGESYVISELNENSVRMALENIRTKFGEIGALVHFTGDYDYSIPFSSLARTDWDMLVGRFVLIPALLTKLAVNTMAPLGAASEPSKFANSQGLVIIVGPHAPVGKKISGLVRARSEVFRGGLRPYVATVNQELKDVLHSNMKIFLLLPGNINGDKPDDQILFDSISNLISGSSVKKNESIFYIDEGRN
jgi:NAD(P)-dependent dehydrogenase (short-subunit alcohol dehydrogenase family)